MSNDSFVSLLYPAGYSFEARSASDRAFISALSAESLFNVMRNAFRFNPNHSHPIEYMTDEIDVINYRQDVVEDFINNDSLCRLFERLLPDLEDMKEIFTADKGMQTDPTAALYSITLVELYTGCIDKIYTFFNTEQITLRSSGMRFFAEKIKEIYESNEFQSLKAETEKMIYSIRNIKSITIGVNLDAQLKPIEAGVISINTSMYRSGNIIDKMLRLDFKDDPFICLAPLEVAGKGLAPNQISAFRSAVNSTLSTLLKSSVKSWQPIIRRFTVSQSQLLSIAELVSRRCLLRLSNQY